VVEFVYLAHGVVEDGGDDAAVAVAGRSGVALAEAEAADESLAGFVEREFQAHAFGVVHAADEAVVFLHLHVAGVVAFGLRLAWHGTDSIAGVSNRVQTKALNRKDRKERPRRSRRRAERMKGRFPDRREEHAKEEDRCLAAVGEMLCEAAFAKHNLRSK
jgi:hypothetical protein